MKTKVLYGIMGCILNLLDTLGVGSNATQAAFFKFTKLSPDEELPGNGNVIFAIPVGVEALLFLKIVEVEPVTLFSMLIAAMLGGIVGSKVFTKIPVQKIRMILSVTLPCVAVLLVMKVNGFGPFGMLGTATGLSGGKLILSVAINFILGMLMCAGVGLYAPCMATCLLLGVDAATCFPVFMGSCACLMPACSIEFIKSHRYDVPQTVGNALGGCIGLFIAWKVVTGLPMFWLINLICIVLLWTSYTLLSAAKKDKAKGIA